MSKNIQTLFNETRYIGIFITSSAMVGVCLMGIGVLRLVAESEYLISIARNFLTIDALGFLASGILSYVVLRGGENKRRILFEQTTNFIFPAAFILLTAACLLIVREFVPTG